VADLLADENVDLVAIRCSGEVRVATIVLEDSGRVTVLNEPGPRLSAEEWSAYEQAVETNLNEGFLVCSGSTPPGTPIDAFARLAKGRLALVDATGQALAAALEARPEWVTPNVTEAEEALFGRAWQSTSAGADAADRAAGAAAELVRRGANNAAVTAGQAGVAVDGVDGPSFVRAPWIRQRNPIGAGDCFAAALVVALEAGRPPAEAIRNAVAVAAASVETDVPGIFDPDRARRLEQEALV
jgi:fructose-1-phosphate kinase PfkB-like protein